ncbi:MAG: hypothetical protein U9O98_06820 [Asgard group archaeon]|nr:hypothetical protein [Asgard group archaeon]
MEPIICSKINLTAETTSSLLPDEIRKELEKKGSVFLSVYTKRSNTLRFFPIKEENLHWLKVALKNFTPETSGKLLAELSKLVSEFVYSTGICVTKSDCFWDGIILESAFKKKQEEIINTIKEIENVKKVTINMIE